MKAPAVSVVMPVYNAERYLDESMGSVLLQTFTDFELVAVDDGSTDRSPEVLRRWALRDPRVVVYTRENGGIVAALNDGIAASRGPLIARTDADDICLPQRLARQVAYLERHPECVALGTDMQLLDPYGSPTKRVGPPLAHEDIEAQYLSGYGYALVHASAMMQREAVLSAGGYDRRFDKAEDVDLFLRLAERGRLANLPEVLMRCRQHFASLSQSCHREQSALKVQAIREAYARRGLAVPEELGISPELRLPPSAQHLYWALWALRRMHPAIAWKHGLSSLRHAPRSPASLDQTLRATLAAARVWLGYRWRF